MRVRCVIETDRTFPDLTPESKKSIKWTCAITPGEVNVVLALTFTTEPMFHGRGVTLEILDDSEQRALAPLRFFKIVDPRPSKHWEAKQIDDGAGRDDRRRRRRGSGRCLGALAKS